MVKIGGGIRHLTTDSNPNDPYHLICADREKDSASNAPILVNFLLAFDALSGQKVVFRGSRKYFGTLLFSDQSFKKIVHMWSEKLALSIQKGQLLNRSKKIFRLLKTALGMPL